jgi:DNA topoisomerase-1
MSPRNTRKPGLDAAVPHEAARLASLRHVSDETPGMTRALRGKGFSYRTPDGQVIRDRGTLKRIRELVIPPAWTEVWICPMENGHIQATGRDARGRKQYCYHARWHEVRDENKFDRMIQFGRSLPALRAKADADLALPGLPLEKALATVVSLLESTFIRIGGREYARTNDSFGLTTMLNRHVKVAGSQIRFRFRGKSGKDHIISVTDRRIARLVKQCRDLPGQTLFQYLDENDEVRAIDAGDVNEYLKSIAGPEFTAKDFRTWAGTLLAAEWLSEVPGEESSIPTLTEVIKEVAKALGNTPAVCRKSYIHPAILSAFRDEMERARWQKALACEAEREGLSAEEWALLRFLDEGAPRAES